MGFNGFLKKILPNRLYASLRQMSPAAGRADILHEISVLAAEVNKLQAGMAALRAKRSQEIRTVQKETQALAAAAALQKTAAEAAAHKGTCLGHDQAGRSRMGASVRSTTVGSGSLRALLP